MESDKPERPVSPELRRLQQPAQATIRTGLRVAGPIIFLLGLLCVLVATVELFTAGMEPPRHFWLAFIGIPLMFVGGVLSMYGFMGAVARFAAGEAAPVATDAVKYV